jgi:hypothetical protein
MYFVYEIKAGSVTLNDRLLFLDIRTNNNANPWGEIRLRNEDGALSGAFNVGDPITVAAGLTFDGAGIPPVLLTGRIVERYDETAFRAILHGRTDELNEKRFKRSFNGASPALILAEVLRSSGLPYSLGTLPDKKYHAYIAANGTIVEEVNRINKTFGLNLAPYMDREGVFHVKTAEESRNPTDTVFNAGEFKSFEKNILETVFDKAVDIYDEIKVLGNSYIVTDNHFYYDANRTKSLITLANI